MTLATIFGLELTTYGLGCAAALLLGLLAVYLQGRRRGMPSATFWCFALLCVPFAWLCSRVVYVLANIPYYTGTLNGNWEPALQVTDGGYSMLGAMLGAMAAAWISAKLTGVRTARVMDTLGIALPVAVIVERIAEAGTGSGIGRELAAVWMQNAGLGVYNEAGDLVHAVFVYEAIAALVILLVLVIWERRKELPDGDVMLLFLTLFGTSQVVMESLRADNHMVITVIFTPVQQVGAIVMAAVAASIWSNRYLRNGGSVKGLIIGWLVIAAAVGLAIYANFMVDRSANKLLAYGLMTACCAAIAAVALLMRRKE